MFSQRRLLMDAFALCRRRRCQWSLPPTFDRLRSAMPGVYLLTRPREWDKGYPESGTRGLATYSSALHPSWIVVPPKRLPRLSRDPPVMHSIAPAMASSLGRVRGTLPGRGRKLADRTPSPGVAVPNGTACCIWGAGRLSRRNSSAGICSGSRGCVGLFNDGPGPSEIADLLHGVLVLPMPKCPMFVTSLIVLSSQGFSLVGSRFR